MLKWTAKWLSYLGRPALRQKRLEASTANTDNAADVLETRNRTLANPAAGRADPDSFSESAAESCAQHGVRGRASGSAHAGAGTRQPHSATHFLTTTLGIISYAELAPHLATRVQALQSAIVSGEFDDRTLDENLLLEFHRRICGDLIAKLAGRWRTIDVVVGGYEPPAYPLVPQRMREYALDLQTRLASLPQQPNDPWLETLAFAEGRLLSIHPFADFNGRVSRIFIDLLTRVLNLPDVDPTPDPGESTAQYLAAPREADSNDWRALMDIWRRRIGEAVP